MKIKKLNGFTLVELMVVVTIIILLSGVSVAAYFQFSQRQAVLNDARNFVTSMKKAQAMAKNLVYPEGCDSKLSRYRIKSDCVGENCRTMTIYAYCDNVPPTIIENEEVLTKSFFTEEVDISFAAGTGIISPIGSFPFSNTVGGYTVVVTIDQIGNISTEEHETYP